MTSSKRLLQQHSEQLEMETKDIFQLAMRENAFAEMTKMIRKKEKIGFTTVKHYTHCFVDTSLQEETYNIVQLISSTSNEKTENP